ncbi:MAG: 50S ribosomal protein L17 [Candidatus Omnitrophica bacterium]|nr:50S ribosomal protein L17 [Candidatus Omnitrophota bacterium]
MRHRKERNQLNRFTSWRKATLRAIARNVIIHQSIKTTLVKAKAARPVVEELITLAKDNNLAARRQAYRILGDHALVKRLFTDIGPLFSKRRGGYTRIINIGNRRGDDAAVAVFELTEIKKKEVKPGKGKVSRKAEQPPASGQEPQKVPEQKDGKKFLGGLRNIFRKERE